MMPLRVNFRIFPPRLSARKKLPALSKPNPRPELKKFSRSQIISAAQRGRESIIISPERRAMSTNAATLLCRICSPENTNSSAKASCNCSHGAVSQCFSLNASTRGGYHSAVGLTKAFAAASLTDEYPVRARGAEFSSQPRHKKRKNKRNHAVNCARHDRATCFAGWVQDCRRSGQEPRFVFVQLSR